MKSKVYIIRNLKGLYLTLNGFNKKKSNAIKIYGDDSLTEHLRIIRAKGHKVTFEYSSNESISATLKTTELAHERLKFLSTIRNSKSKKSIVKHAVEQEIERKKDIIALTKGNIK